MPSKTKKDLQKDLDDMLKNINNLKSDSEHIKELNNKIFHLEFLIKQAGLKLRNISDLVEVIHYYANEDDTRLGGALDAVNSMILETWFNLEDKE